MDEILSNSGAGDGGGGRTSEQVPINFEIARSTLAVDSRPVCKGSQSMLCQVLRSPPTGNILRVANWDTYRSRFTS